ncbi:MAG TPA: ComEC/Rec2 family competence protein [Puia sp.]|nr:ComEC/Rec2 family competence protein [Puia sp.]
MHVRTLPLWKEAPFTRLLPALCAGILLQWYLSLPVTVTMTVFPAATLTTVLLDTGPMAIRYHRSFIYGILLNLQILCLGSAITWRQDERVRDNWLNQVYRRGDYIIARLDEPISEKPRSFKTVASVNSLCRGDRPLRTQGSLFIYFSREARDSRLQPGTRILFTKPFEPISNSGNPGSFDYQRYCHFQHVYGQVYLKKNDYTVLPGKRQSPWKKAIFTLREKLLDNIRKFINDEQACGLAEALLLGYKEDLDRDLAQSYADTGTAHIIAISGLHLALIFTVLQFLLRPLPERGAVKWLKPVTIIASLWLFSFLSGASPSVLRSAAMFTCLVVGNSFSKQGSVFNSLAASAFLLLCWNPFWLWDIGFQLSYSAVISIVIFMKPLYALLFIRNKALDFLWKSVSVTLAAQVLTFPLGIYYFHQFPNYFLLTNLPAVPLSSVILLGEVFISMFSFLPVLAIPAGRLLAWMIHVLNDFIGYMSRLPFSTWDALLLTLPQLILVYGFISALSAWLMRKTGSCLFLALFALLLYVSARSVSFWKAGRQRLLLVYHIPKQQAIDFIAGRKYVFLGDPVFRENDLLRRRFLDPARTNYRIVEASPSLHTPRYNLYCRWNQKKIVLIGGPVTGLSLQRRIRVDLIILSHNTAVSIRWLSRHFDAKQWVFDDSNDHRKVAWWKRECEELGLNCYSLVDKGCFVMNMD